MSRAEEWLEVEVADFPEADRDDARQALRKTALYQWIAFGDAQRECGRALMDALPWRKSTK